MYPLLGSFVVYNVVSVVLNPYFVFHASAIPSWREEVQGVPAARGGNPPTSDWSVIIVPVLVLNSLMRLMSTAS